MEVFIVDEVDEDMATLFFALYCVGIIIWSTMFTETWKQEQYKTSIQWG